MNCFIAILLFLTPVLVAEGKELALVFPASVLADAADVRSEEAPVSGPNQPGILVQVLILLSSVGLVVVFARLAFKGKFKGD